MADISDELREAIDTDPFGEVAMRYARDRRQSSAEERAARAADVEHLRTHGWVVLSGAASPDLLWDAREELDRLSAEEPTGSNTFAGRHTKRVFNLVGRTRLFDPLLRHPDVLAVAEAYLDDQIQLSIASSIQLGPGGEAQTLHRDDSYYALPRPHPPLAVNVLWAVDDFTEDNGATRFVPRSHAWPSERAPSEDEVRTAVMTAGSAFVFDAGLLHGGGENRTSRWRSTLSVMYARAWLRQQENQYLALPTELVASFDRRFQRLLGYAMYGATLGNVDGADPRHWLAVGADAPAASTHG